MVSPCIDGAFVLSFHLSSFLKGEYVLKISLWRIPYKHTFFSSFNLVHILPLKTGKRSGES